jgi:membrane protease YdiL (CAAX protease family)
MNESPFMILLYVGVAVYVGQMYWSDYQSNRSSGDVDPRGMPGATPASFVLYVIGVVGALVILAAETGGEIALGIASEQSEMVWYFVFASLGAGIVEEVIFRGYLVVENKGKAALVGSCVGFSLIFAIIHGHFWSHEAGEPFTFTFTTKAFFTTGILLANSLWFYALRFARWNPKRSLFPCMLAHAASNLGVFVVKWVQGYVQF